MNTIYPCTSAEQEMCAPKISQQENYIIHLLEIKLINHKEYICIYEISLTKPVTPWIPIVLPSRLVPTPYHSIIRNGTRGNQISNFADRIRFQLSLRFRPGSALELNLDHELFGQVNKTFLCSSVPDP
jgi:hypothetical protein